MAAAICSIEALMLYQNLSILVLLPVVAYALDCILLTLVSGCGLLKSDNALDWWIVIWSMVISISAVALVFEDYRLDPISVPFIIGGVSLTSLARVLPSIGPQLPQTGKHTWDCSMKWFLWAGMPPCLCVAAYAAYKYEDVAQASDLVKDWGFSTTLEYLAPGVFTHLFWNKPLRSTLPLSTTNGLSYQSGGENVLDAIDATVLVSLILLPISTIVETNLIDWKQVLVFVMIYVFSVGPKQISLYPPKFVNFLRRRVRDTRWYAVFHKPAYLVSVNLLFAFFTSTFLLYWTDSVSFEHSLKSWPSIPSIVDVAYRAPSRDRLEIIIGHIEGEAVQGVADLITFVTSNSALLFFNPRITIYTKSTSENVTHEILDATGIDESSIKLLKNTGGTTATYLQHILEHWDTLPTQTIFLSSAASTTQDLDLITRRISQYHAVPAGYPFPETIFPITGFLHLGTYRSCDCETCHEVEAGPDGWSDTFNLIPSMWGAAHAESEEACKKVLLTHGNNFIASAARIRGVKKDVWETLYNGLVNEDLENAWAHDDKKIGVERNLTIAGEGDSLQKPFLGYTVERLWAVLLQCSTREVAWRCPTLNVGWRRGGAKEDCSCID
ncbi:hypothetical protein PVAG01_04906 [Phlyctema vagabunda]|uniref:Uncharacterized protein n=1 Tax=Phlyctema vagabunda TaxID=108571 RepID=A0ABR4PIN7_9HELO